METDIKTKVAAQFDPLDMNNYKVEKLPKMQKSKFEIWMARLGGPLAIAAFVWICWFCHIGFIDNLNQTTLAATAQKRLDALGFDGFIRANQPPSTTSTVLPSNQTAWMWRPRMESW